MTDRLETTFLPKAADLVSVAEASTVSRTIIKGDGVNLVLFAFDLGQELSEHTAAMPVLLQVLDGALEVTAASRTVVMTPGDVMYLPAREPHSVLAMEPSRLLLTMVVAAKG